MKLDDHPTVQRIRLKTVEGQPSRTLRWDEIVAWQPEVVFIACCGFGVERMLADVPLLQTVPAWLDLPAVRSGRIYVTAPSISTARHISLGLADSQTVRMPARIK